MTESSGWSRASFQNSIVSALLAGAAAAAVAVVLAALLDVTTVAAAVDAALVVAALVATVDAGAALDAALVAVVGAALDVAAVYTDVVTAADPPQAARRPTEPLTTRERQVRRDNRTAFMDDSFAAEDPTLRTPTEECPRPSGSSRPARSPGSYG